MTREQALEQYQYEVFMYEMWGDKNIVTFEEWLDIKGIIIREGGEE